ncbi:MAG: hypothetical protein AAGA48_15420 [Myxococcota bacterium]
MQRWWIGIVAVVGVALAFFLFPRPDRGATVAPNPDAPKAQAGRGTAEAPPPDFGPARRAKRKAKNAEKPPVAPEVIAAQERLAELRARPDAQASAKLIGAWSGVRKTLMESEAPEAAEFAERLKQPLGDLANFRRNPEEGVPFEQIQAPLDELHEEISTSPFANEGLIPGGLKRHLETLEELNAMKTEN